MQAVEGEDVVKSVFQVLGESFRGNVQLHERHLPVLLVPFAGELHHLIRNVATDELLGLLGEPGQQHLHGHLAVAAADVQDLIKALRLQLNQSEIFVQKVQGVLHLHIFVFRVQIGVVHPSPL